MNSHDKALYKALKFLSKNSVKKCKEMEKNNPKKYYKHVSKAMEESLEESNLIEFNYQEEDFSPVIGKGVTQLRILEDIKRKEKSILISIGALVISVGAFIISLVALNK